MAQMVERHEYTHFHMCCGMGGSAEGVNEAVTQMGLLEAVWRCVGGMDVSPSAIQNFTHRAGVQGTLADLFTRLQYIKFHGREPPAGWREVTPDDVRRAAHGEWPDFGFISAPCKGFSGLLSQAMSLTPKYQALNELTLRCVWLLLEAFKDRPIKIIAFENVPRIETRGAWLVDQIVALFRSYGYAVNPSKYDCGKLGGLAQSRPRFLLMARHMELVPPFLYEPPMQRLLGIGEILDRMPLPGDPIGGAMHRVPQLSWKTWVRLAFVEAGKDWRSLNHLNVEDGYLTDYLIMPERQNGFLGVNRWEDTAGTVRGRSLPNNGPFSVADMRPPHGADQYQQYGVMSMNDTPGVVTGHRSPGQGTFSVADPRPTHGVGAHTNKFRIIPYDGVPGVVTGTDRVGSGAACVADPLPRWQNRYNNMAVGKWEDATGVVTGGGKGVQGGWISVADPRPEGMRGERSHYNTQGHYGVMSGDQPSGAVPAFGKLDNGSWSVADRREGAEAFFTGPAPELPAADQRLSCIIRALDGTWHRPVTTLEMGALQSLVEPEDPDTWIIYGSSDGEIREHIGNAVPKKAATAMGQVVGQTLLLAEKGETFFLSSTNIWVRPHALALTLDMSGVPA
jgi:site-specific DNA-cytosine methylase